MPPVNQIFTLFTEILGIVRVAQDLRNVRKYHRRLANPPTFVRADQTKPEGHAEPRPVLKVWMGKGCKDRLVRIHGELQVAFHKHIRYLRLSAGPLVCVTAPRRGDGTRRHWPEPNRMVRFLEAAEWPRTH